MENALIIFKQMFIMFIYMGIGFYMFHKKLMSHEGSKGLANLLLYIILPSVIIKSFCSGDAQDKGLFLISVLLGAAALLLAMVLAAVFFKKRPVDNFATAFSNAGFMGIPLIHAIAGSEAVLYITGMVSFLNILQWFYGQGILAEQKVGLQIKDLMRNPLIISFLTGIIILFGNVKVPGLLLEPVQALASLNAPTAMIILGGYLAQTDIKQLFTEGRLYYAAAIRLIIIPVCTIFMLSLFYNIPYEVRLSILIAASAPAGSNVAVYAQRLNKDYVYAVKTVCLSTLLSILTMPVCIYIAEWLWN